MPGTGGRGQLLPDQTAYPDLVVAIVSVLAVIAALNYPIEGGRDDQK
jgi:hypothetical protein